MKSTLLVKIFLVLNLLFCAAAAGFGYVIFQDRQLVKARTVLLQEHVEDAAESLKFGEQQEWETSAQGDGAFRAPLPASSSELEEFTSTLDSLEAAAAARADQLAENLDAVQSAKASLSSKQAELAEKESDLTSTRSEVTQMETTLSTTKESLREIQEDKANIGTITQKLKDQLAKLNQQTETLREEISTTKETLDMRTQEKNRIEELLAACRQPRNEDGGDENWHQKTAKVLAAEPEWNYVVINKGEVDVLPLFLEAFVHRGDEFIGKIRVMQVEDTVALAEIIQDSMTPGMQVQSGDTIFF